MPFLRRIDVQKAWRREFIQGCSIVQAIRLSLMAPWVGVVCHLFRRLFVQPPQTRVTLMLPLVQVDYADVVESGSAFVPAGAYCMCHGEHMPCPILVLTEALVGDSQRQETPPPKPTNKV